MGLENAVGMVTCCGLEGTGIESWWGQNFLHGSRLTLARASQTSYTVGSASFPWVEWLERGINHSSPNAAQSYLLMTQASVLQIPRLNLSSVLTLNALKRTGFKCRLPAYTHKNALAVLFVNIALCERKSSSMLPDVMKSLSKHICTCINMTSISIEIGHGGSSWNVSLLLRAEKNAAFLSRQ
jgi:hypothetical protein